MTKLTIPPGVIVVAHPDNDAADENRQRASSGGTLFIGPWAVWLHGDYKSLEKVLIAACVRQSWHLHTSPDRLTVLLNAFDWRMREAPQPAHAFDRPPYEWAPSLMRESLRTWVWTDAGATLTTSQEDARA